MKIRKREANLHQFPTVCNEGHTHVSVGDIHGNALKLIYILLEEGVLSLNAKEYYRLRDIYNKPVDKLTAKDLFDFNTIISGARVNSKCAVTLIGDELADRGNNDFFTLLVLQKLHTAGTNFDITISNHSAEFIRDFQRPKFTGQVRLGQGQGRSLQNMQQLIAKGLVQEGTVRNLVNDCYMPHVKAIGYTLSAEGEMSLFTHAPVGLETIEALAKKFAIPYKEDTPQELIKTIDAINDKIQVLFQNKTLAQVILEENNLKKDNSKHILPDRPLNRLIWNRMLGEELRTEPKGKFPVKFVHGHIGDGPTLDINKKRVSTHQNLDTSLGKFLTAEKTGFNQIQRGHIEHFTRQSCELTKKELIPEILNQKLNKDVLDSMIQQRRKECIEAQFKMLLTELKTPLDDIIIKGDKRSKAFNPAYQEVADYAQKLVKTLSQAEEDFFKNMKPETFDTFTKTCLTSIKDAEPHFAKHRGTWFQINPTLRGILGVLCIISVLPAVIVSVASKPSLTEIFFNNPATKSSNTINTIQTKLKETFNEMKTNIQQIKGDFEEKENLPPKIH